MGYLKSRWLRGFFKAWNSVQWMPCHEFLVSRRCCLPSFPWLKAEAATTRVGEVVDGDGGLVGFLRSWWLDYDGVKNLLALLLVFTMFAEMRFIASGSMFPTLRVGDRILAEKVTYYFRNPCVNDIVLFKASTLLQDHGLKQSAVFVKRIVANAGDCVEVRHGLLFINGIVRKEDFISEEPEYMIRATHGVFTARGFQHATFFMIEVLMTLLEKKLRTYGSRSGLLHAVDFLCLCEAFHRASDGAKSARSLFHTLLLPIVTSRVARSSWSRVRAGRQSEQ